MAKFTQNPVLQDQLLSTRDALLAEYASKDLIWGIGLSLVDLTYFDPTQWRGTNLLGFLLMEVRAQLRRNNKVFAWESRPWLWNDADDHPQPRFCFSVNDKQEVTCCDENGGCITLFAEACAAFGAEWRTSRQLGTGNAVHGKTEYLGCNCVWSKYTSNLLWDMDRLHRY